MNYHAMPGPGDFWRLYDPPAEPVVYECQQRGCLHEQERPGECEKCGVDDLERIQ